VAKFQEWLKRILINIIFCSELFYFGSSYFILELLDICFLGFQLFGEESELSDKIMHTKSPLPDIACAL